MTAALLPGEVAAALLAALAGILGLLFSSPATFHLRSSGDRAAVLRIVVGAILAFDATLQFLPGSPPVLAYLLVVGAGQDLPSLGWWFSYWAQVIGRDPGFWWYGTGVVSALLAACLIFGFARRLAYGVGVLFGFLLWAVPNGFGGPYAAPNTDIGAGLVYAVAFLTLLLTDSASGPTWFAADTRLERRWPRWRWIGGGPPGKALSGSGRETKAIRPSSPTIESGSDRSAEPPVRPGETVGWPAASPARSRRRGVRETFASSGGTTGLRMLFGAIWIGDGLLRFLPGADPQLSYWLVIMAEDGQPTWLVGWLSAWANLIAGTPAFWWYGIGAIELSIGVCLVVGFLRRPAYLLGLALSLFLWTVPQALGGPYGPGSTDIGTGILYAVIFLAFLHLDGVGKATGITVDAALERRWPSWRRLVQPPVSSPDPPICGHLDRTPDDALTTPP